VALPDDLVFHVNYLGGDMPVFQVNFSRPAGQIIAQYYLFLRLGREGYRKVHMACYESARYLAAEIARMGPFEVVFDGDPEGGIPALTWQLVDGAQPGFSLFDLADRLRIRGWQVPAYSLPPNVSDVVVQRILVRQGFGRDMADLLLDDLRRAVEWFERNPVTVPATEAEAGGFRHG
jgi:glutamate decarboxylase